MNEYQNVKLETRGAVGLLTIDRARALNALDPFTVEEMLSVVRSVREDPSIRALIVTGAGRAFCAGADLSAPAGAESAVPSGEEVAANMRDYYNPIIVEIRALSKPVICAVNGVAAGGGIGLALAADIVLAARSATFIQVFVPRLAIIPDMGSTWFLSQLLGPARARGLALTGEPLTADKAADWGLIWKSVPDETLMADAWSLAERLASLSRVAVEATKGVLDAAQNHALAEQLELERHVQARMFGRPAVGEGLRAFREKREPDFSGD